MNTFSYLRTAGLAILITGMLAAAPAKQPQPKSQKEGEAIMAIFNAQTPDARIAAAESLIANFADTEFKAIALQIAAASAQQKNDFEKMVLYSERTLEADPQSYPAMLMLASGISQRTREFDLDKEEKLTRSDKYARQAIDLVNKAEKPRPDITDEQWAAAKKDYIAQGHEALAIAAVVRKKYDVAISEYKASIDGAATPDPASMVRLADAYAESGKPDDAIATIDKVLAMPDLTPQIKQVAQNEKMKAAKMKSSGAKPPAPPQAEIKK